jgi:hypothetical protein
VPEADITGGVHVFIPKIDELLAAGLTVIVLFPLLWVNKLPLEFVVYPAPWHIPHDVVAAKAVLIAPVILLLVPWKRC